MVQEKTLRPRAGLRASISLSLSFRRFAASSSTKVTIAEFIVGQAWDPR